MNVESQSRLLDFVEHLDSFPGFLGIDGRWYWFGDGENPTVDGTDDLVRLFHFCRKLSNE